MIPIRPSQPITFNKETAENGYMIGSITFPSKLARYNGYFFPIVCMDSNPAIAKKNSGQMRISPNALWKLKHNGQYEDGRTYLFAIPRTPGKYKISGTVLFSNYGRFTTTDFTPFNIPFEIKKGEITYVGNLVYNDRPLKSDTIMKIQDNFERDTNGLKKMYPKVDWNTALQDSERKVEFPN